MNLVGSLILVATGILFVAMAIDTQTIWLATLALGLVVVGVWVAYRSLVIRIAFDAESLHIVGFVWSRRIPRSAVLSVEQHDLEMPMIQWSMPDSADRWSILSPLILNSSPFLPASMYLRRHRFLAQLRRWAPDVDTTHIRRGVWSRITDALGVLFLAVWRSPVLRATVGLGLIVLSAGAYWLGAIGMLGVIQDGDELGRSILSMVGLAGFAGEGAYWALPLRSRRPRAWHITLAVLMGPLVVMTLVAMFS